jgi:hypothetical protein
MSLGGTKKTTWYPYLHPSPLSPSFTHYLPCSRNALDVQAAAATRKRTVFIGAAAARGSASFGRAEAAQVFSDVVKDSGLDADELRYSWKKVRWLISSTISRCCLHCRLPEAAP